MFAYMGRDRSKHFQFINGPQEAAGRVLGEILDRPPEPQMHQFTSRVAGLAAKPELTHWAWGLLLRSDSWDLSPTPVTANCPRLGLAVRNWAPGLQAAYEKFEGRKNSDSIAVALHLLSGGIGKFPAEGFKQCVVRLLNELAADQARFDFVAAVAADEEVLCPPPELDAGHRRMWMALETWRAVNVEHDAKPAQLLGRLRQHFHLQLLNELAKTLAVGTPASGLKIMLALLPLLNEELRLGLPASDQVPDAAKLAQALAGEFRQAEQEHFKTWLQVQPAWLAWVRRSFPVEAQALREEYLALASGMEDPSPSRKEVALRNQQREAIYEKATVDFPRKLCEMALQTIGVVGELSQWLSANADVTTTTSTAASTATTTTTSTTITTTTTSTTTSATTSATSTTQASTGEKTEGSL